MEQRPNVDVTLRPYEESDHERVRWLFTRTPPWGRTYPLPEPVPGEIERMPPHFLCPLVATEMDIAGEAIVGFAAAGPAHHDGMDALPEFVTSPEDSAQLFWMSVAPERWRLGIGRRLVEAVSEWARDAGFGAVILETNIEQRGAQATYEACGFVKIGENVLGDRWHQIWYWRDL